MQSAPIEISHYQAKRQAERQKDVSSAATQIAVQEPKTSVAPTHNVRTDLASLSLGQAMQVAKSLFASGYFDKVKNPEQAFAKILAGQELGIGPMQALASIHIVEGKPTLDATLVRARIKSSGKYDIRTLVSTDEKCSLQFLEHGRVLGVCTFTIEDAKRAGLLGKTNWQRYPKAMCLARCTMSGAREFTPDVFGGPIYSAEELERDNAPLPEDAPPEQPKNVTPQDQIKEKHEQGLVAVRTLIGEKQIPETVVAAEWAKIIGETIATYPTWEDGELAMLREFYGVLLKITPETSTTTEAVATQAESTAPQAENPDAALTADLNSFADPKPEPKETPVSIDMKMIEQFRGMIPLPDMNVLRVVAEEKGLSGVALRDIVKKATGGGELTKATYDKLLSTLEQLPKKNG